MSIILPEIIAAGIYNSQIAAKNKIITKSRKTTMFEIEIPVEKGGISYIDDEHSAISTDMIICAKPNQTRHSRLPFKCRYIHMIVHEGILYDTLINAPNFIKTGNYEKYNEILKKICKYSGTGVPSDEITVQSLVLELIHTIFTDTKKQNMNTKAKNNNYEITEKVIKYIKENLTQDLSLNAVSSYTGFSPVHFHNLFKSATGKTLHRYVEEQRIKKAVDMLISTNNTLTKIAYECGFSSQSYFSSAFKRKMNTTPREYAKKIMDRYNTD